LELDLKNLGKLWRATGNQWAGRMPPAGWTALRYIGLCSIGLLVVIVNFTAGAWIAPGVDNVATKEVYN